MMKKKSDPGDHYRIRPVTSALRAATIAVSLCLGLAAPFLAPPQALAQTRTIERTIDGTVNDKAGAPINGAIVYLKDSKSSSIKTFICGSDGRFHFGNLSQNVDYDLWSEISGHKSKTRSISSFDDKNKFNFTLTIETK